MKQMEIIIYLRQITTLLVQIKVQINSLTKIRKKKIRKTKSLKSIIFIRKK